jgi:hydrogenase expression/formation protein HypC
MCIGIPMQVIEADGRFALCEGRGERRRINTALVGDVVPGDWLLVFLDDAREPIDADRAAEVNAALDLVLGAMQGLETQEDAGFALPSQMTPEQMRALTTAGPHAPPFHGSLPPEGADSPWGGPAANRAMNF